jgi:hypothetical protein
MSIQVAHHKNNELADLIALAADVDMSAPCGAGAYLSAREAARALAGVASWVASRTSVRDMHEVMMSLARYVDAWRGPSYLAKLPAVNGYVNEHVALVAVVASSLVSLFGPRNLRAAVAYWASERDPASWRRVVEA